MWRNYINHTLVAVLTLLLAGCAGRAVKPVVEPVQVPADLAIAPAAVQRDYLAALEQMERRNDAAAASQFEDFVVRNPEYPGAYVNLAIIYDRQNRSEDAMSLLNKAMEADPVSVYALNRLG